MHPSSSLYLKPLAAALVAAFSLGGAMAQDIPGATPGASPESATTGSRLDRVEIRSRQPSDNDLRRRAQVAKQVYGREEMDRNGDTNVADVLNRLPGVSVQNNAPRMRGLGSGYTLLLINGDPAPPGFALDQLSPSQVERIEVSKGPTANQSAQAVAGSINVILKDAPRKAQRDLRLGLGYQVERPTLNANYTYGERWDGGSLSLPVSFFQWRGGDSSTVDRLQPGSDLLPARSVQSVEQGFWGHGFNIAPRLNWRLSDDENLTWQNFVQRGEWNNDSTLVSRVLSGNPVLDDPARNGGTWQNIRSNLQWVNNFTAEDRIELKAGVSTSRGTFDVRTLRAGEVQRRALGDNTDLSLTQAGNYNRLLNDAHSLMAGWDLEWREREEKREITERGVALLPDQDNQPFKAQVMRQAFFVQDEWEINKQWSTYLGVRAERIATQSQGIDLNVSNTSTVVTPMWHVNYKLEPAGRDMIRASITRSYKAPNAGALLSRRFISLQYPDLSATNSELSPDRAGNPDLLPELATGLDMAWENYLPGGGLISVGVFVRDVTDLVRNVTRLQPASGTTAARWLSRPENFSRAQTSGLELELKGRAGELLPALFGPKLPLNLRANLSFYQSSVDALPGPNNRLDGQQPWSGSIGGDYRPAGLPLTIGGSLAFTPDYITQQSLSQSLELSRTRTIDLFAQWVFNPKLSMRISTNNLMPVEVQSQTLTSGGFGTTSQRTGRTNWQAGLEMKL